MNSASEKPKLFESSTIVKQKKYLTKTQVENEIENLYTTRSCPTGYEEEEIKNCTNEELINLRNMTFEYLKYRSSKTRNVQFVHLIKRLNQELIMRKVDTNLILNSNDYSKSTVSFNTIYGGEYTLTRRSGSSNAEGSCKSTSESSMGSNDSKPAREKSYIIFTKYFTVKALQEIKIPSFIHDIDLENSSNKNSIQILFNKPSCHKATIDSIASGSNLIDDSSYTSLDLREESQSCRGSINPSFSSENSSKTEKGYDSNIRSFDIIGRFQNKNVFTVDFDFQNKSGKPDNDMLLSNKREESEAYNFSWV